MWVWTGSFVGLVGPGNSEKLSEENPVEPWSKDCTGWVVSVGTDTQTMWEFLGYPVLWYRV